MFLKLTNILFILLFLFLKTATSKAFELKNLDLQVVGSNYVVVVHQAELQGYLSNTLQQKTKNCNSTVTLYVKREWCSIHSNTSLMMPSSEEFMFYLHRNGHVDGKQIDDLHEDCRRTKTYFLKYHKIGVVIYMFLTCFTSSYLCQIVIYSKEKQLYFTVK
jgi:hypothetical protein